MIKSPATPGIINTMKRYINAAEKDCSALIPIELNRKTMIASSEPIPFKVKGNSLPKVKIGETM